MFFPHIVSVGPGHLGGIEPGVNAAVVEFKLIDGPGRPSPVEPQRPSLIKVVAGAAAVMAVLRLLAADGLPALFADGLPYRADGLPAVRAHPLLRHPAAQGTGVGVLKAQQGLRRPFRRFSSVLSYLRLSADFQLSFHLYAVLAKLPYSLIQTCVPVLLPVVLYHTLTYRLTPHDGHTFSRPGHRRVQQVPVVQLSGP